MAAPGDVLFSLGHSDGNESDIWDDTALIKAYDKAINSVKAEINGEQQEEEQEEGLEEPGSEPTQKRAAKKGKNKRKKRKSSSRHKWKVGDRCAAVFSEDNLVYDAVIKSTNYKLGTCWITYTGYGNEEEKHFDELMAPVQEGMSQEEDFSENGYESLEMDSFSNPSLSPHYGNMREYPPPPQQRRLKHPTGPTWQLHHPHLWNNQSFPPQGSVFPQTSFAPPPPPPGPFHAREPRSVLHPPQMSLSDDEQDALYAMLMAWYMSGYHTGYYQGLKGAQKRKGGKTNR